MLNACRSSPVFTTIFSSILNLEEYFRSWLQVSLNNFQIYILIAN